MSVPKIGAKPEIEAGIEKRRLTPEQGPASERGRSLSQHLYQVPQVTGRAEVGEEAPLDFVSTPMPPLGSYLLSALGGAEDDFTVMTEELAANERFRSAMQMLAFIATYTESKHRGLGIPVFVALLDLIYRDISVMAAFTRSGITSGSLRTAAASLIKEGMEAYAEYIRAETMAAGSETTKVSTTAKAHDLVARIGILPADVSEYVTYPDLPPAYYELAAKTQSYIEGFVREQLEGSQPSQQYPYAQAEMAEERVREEVQRAREIERLVKVTAIHLPGAHNLSDEEDTEEVAAAASMESISANKGQCNETDDGDGGETQEKTAPMPLFNGWVEVGPDEEMM